MDKWFGKARSGILNKVAGHRFHNRSPLSAVTGGAHTT